MPWVVSVLSVPGILTGQPCPAQCKDHGKPGKAGLTGRVLVILGFGLGIQNLWGLELVVSPEVAGWVGCLCPSG